MASKSIEDRQVTIDDFEFDTIYDDVPWEVYRELNDDEANYHLRMTYLDGTFVIMSPAYRHDSPTALFGQVIRGVALVNRIKYRSLGSTTLWLAGGSRRQGTGKEPDTAFHIGKSVDATRGMTDLRLDQYPPPDLAVEVENTVDAHLLLPLYARLRVPELWIYRVQPRRLWFGRLSGNIYETADRSLCLPSLSPELVLHALQTYELGDSDEGAWFTWLQEWARGLPQS